MTANDSEIAAFVEALRPVRVSPDGPYTPQDRYNEFHQLFSSEAGKRVLSQIIDYAEGRPISIHDIDSHAKLAFRAGQRDVALRILAWTTMQPPRTADRP